MPSQFLSTESYARSDQIAFAKAGIPAILIMEGLNYKNISREQGLRLMIDWQQHIYHSPFDDLNQPMNFEAAQQHCQVIFAFCNYLANSLVKPEWQPGAPYINARLRSIAEKR
ncbi:MAG: M28 family peptidase [Bacteroidales bacterium]|nr:M28 family peptidase [Bacteroidales bacterium]